MKLSLAEAAFARSSEVALMCGWITKAENVPPRPRLQVHPSISLPPLPRSPIPGPMTGPLLPPPPSTSRRHISAPCTLSLAQDLGPLELFLSRDARQAGVQGLVPAPWAGHSKFLDRQYVLTLLARWREVLAGAADNEPVCLPTPP